MQPFPPPSVYTPGVQMIRADLLSIPMLCRYFVNVYYFWHQAVARLANQINPLVNK